jgi:tetratricopeptide (TPR) repeat protein
MTKHCNNHTTTLSAAITNSSVSAMLNDFSSLLDINSEDSNRSPTQESSRVQEVANPIIHLLTDMFEAGKFSATLEVAEQLLINFPKSVFILNVIAECHGKLGDDIKAINYYHSTMDNIQPHEDDKLSLAYLPNIHNNMGVCLKSVGFLDLSEICLKKAINLDPKSSTAYNNYGNLLSDQAEIEKAQKSFLKAIELDPSNYKAYWNLHSTVDNSDHAKDIIELCLAQSPNFPEGIFTLSGLKAFSGDQSHFK